VFDYCIDENQFPGDSKETLRKCVRRVKYGKYRAKGLEQRAYCIGFRLSGRVEEAPVPMD
jgi:hypothetical protein